jgi:hypothetical protein
MSESKERDSRRQRLIDVFTLGGISTATGPFKPD